MVRVIQQQLQRRKQQLLWLGKLLRHPGQRLQEKAQRLDELEMRLTQAQRNLTRHKKARLDTLRARLERHSPIIGLRQSRQLHQELSRRLQKAIQMRVKLLQQRLATQAHALETVSPLATLSRGYTIVSTEKNDNVLRSSDEVSVGERVRARLHQGQLLCRVEEILK